jgi:hypothetical protein
MVAPAIAQDDTTGAAKPRVIHFFDRDGVTVTFVNAPNMGGSGASSSGTPAQWMKVEFHYSVTPATAVPWVDAVQFKIWIEGRDMFAPDAPGKDGVAVALTGDVTYVNLAKGRDAYGVFYVHPSTLARYSTTEGGVEDFDRKFDVHVEAYVGGQLVDYINRRQETDQQNWIKPLRPVPGLVLRSDQSPFIMADPDRYPAMKRSAPASP